MDYLRHFLSSDFICSTANLTTMISNALLLLEKIKLTFMDNERQLTRCANNWPTLAWRNLLPILLSKPTAWATSRTSAPVASHTADIALIDEMRCARNAFAAWTINHKVLITFSLDTFRALHKEYENWNISYKRKQISKVFFPKYVSKLQCCRNSIHA